MRLISQTIVTTSQTSFSSTIPQNNFYPIIDGLYKGR